MSLKIYNSLSNQIEEFIPIHKGMVNMYVCGPTVYNDIHIGNARPVIFFDVLKKYLTFCGYKVTYASNITDIDDKIINKAISLGTTEEFIAKKYEEAFFKATELIGSVKPDLIPHAVEYIPEMISFINELVQKGYAYNVNGDVYFRINSISNYGILSNQVSEELTKGARVSVDLKKENPLDFALWKKTETGIKFDSPFGLGRPGWHTECVVMNHKLFGEMIDIHGGGMDLKFPHHENEIAQSEALYKNTLAKYWIHVGRLDLLGEKMSKSLGNVILVKDLKDKKSAMITRMVIAFSPYRANIQYSNDLYSQYEKEYDKWRRALQQATLQLQINDIKNTNCDEDIIDKFKNFMDDDINVQNVMTLINDLVKDINQLVRNNDLENLRLKVNTFNQILAVFSIDLEVSLLSEENLKSYKAWLQARKDKDFAKADLLRNELVSKGIL